MPVKDWDALLKDYSSGEDSDAHDSLNVMSVQKNAHRIANLLHATMPGLDPSMARDAPMGMNRPDVIRRDFEAHASRFRGDVKTPTTVDSTGGGDEGVEDGKGAHTTHTAS